MKKSIFLFVALFSGLFLTGLIGQGRVQISGFLQFNDPLDFQNYQFKSKFNADSISWDGSFFDNAVPGIALGFWTKTGRTLHEFQWDGKTPGGGTGKGWQYTGDSTGTGYSISNGRISINYGLFYNLLPQSKRLAFFPGVGMRPFYNGFSFAPGSTQLNFQGTKSVGFEITFLPRLMLKMRRGLFVDLTWALATSNLRVVKSELKGPFLFDEQTNFAYDLKLINGLARIGIGWRFGQGK